jgi:hypothetical protein
MPDITFLRAVEGAQLQYGSERWKSLSAKEQSNAIYRQMRILDLSDVGSPLGGSEPASERESITVDAD